MREIHVTLSGCLSLTRSCQTNRSLQLASAGTRGLRKASYVFRPFEAIVLLFIVQGLQTHTQADTQIYWENKADIKEPRLCGSLGFEWCDFLNANIDISRLKPPTQSIFCTRIKYQNFMGKCFVFPRELYPRQREKVAGEEFGALCEPLQTKPLPRPRDPLSLLLIICNQQVFAKTFSLSTLLNKTLKNVT